MRVYLDLETYSEVPIASGTHVYAAGAEILLYAYAVDEGEVKVIEQMNDELLGLLNNPKATLIAHNTGFDRVVLEHVLGFRVSHERWFDTMVQALAHSLPGGLGALCELYGLPVDVAKDKDGRQLVHLFCKPRPANHNLRRATQETHPDEWARFVEYARLDVAAMREVHKRMPTWNYRGDELALWHLDQRINDRGVAIDMDLVRSALTTVAVEQKRLAKVTKELTDGKLASASQRDAMLEHLLSVFGVALPDLKTSTLERRLDDPNIPPAAKELMAVRLSTATTSTAKYKKFLACTSSDGRLRGTMQFCGASRTGRWAGRLVQPQNLPRPAMKAEDIEVGISAMKADCAELVFEDVMGLASDSIRGCIIAPKGKKLVVSDLSNIEGRVAAWLAKEDWKLDAFREFDLGTGPDLYKLAYAKSFSVDPSTVTKDQRQLGKIQELSLAYGGGVGAFSAFATVYGVDMDDMAEKALDVLPRDLVEQSERYWAMCVKEGRNRFGMQQDAFVVCDTFKRAWRQAHPGIVKIWAALDTAVTEAMLNPFQIQDTHGLRVVASKQWLQIKMPSGRQLCYPQPKFDEGRITYMGVNQYTRKWERIGTYGPKLFENLCQAVARDVLAHGMTLAEKRGYEVVMSVHDELLTEVPDTDHYNVAQLSNLMSTNPSWADGLPLAAAGFEATRYRKD